MAEAATVAFTEATDLIEQEGQSQDEVTVSFDSVVRALECSSRAVTLFSERVRVWCDEEEAVSDRMKMVSLAFEGMARHFDNLSSACGKVIERRPDKFFFSSIGGVRCVLPAAERVVFGILTCEFTFFGLFGKRMLTLK